jgi:hypothetical protein
MTGESSKREEIIIMLDANESMLEEWDPEEDCLGTTKFDVAKYVTAEILSHSSKANSHIHTLSVIILNTRGTHHHYYRDENRIASPSTTTPMTQQTGTNEEKIFPNITEWAEEQDGNLLEKIQGLVIEPSFGRKKRKLASSRDNNDDSIETISTTTSLEGDFLTGLIVAADTFFRKRNNPSTSSSSTTTTTTTGISHETFQQQQLARIILLTDARHKIHVTNQKQLLVAMDSLRAMSCRLNIIGFGFEKGADFSEYLRESNNSNASENNERSAVEEESEEDDDDDDEIDDDDDDLDDIQRQNEALLINLSSKLGGYVLAPKRLEDIVRRVYLEFSQQMLDLCLESRRGREIVQIAANEAAEKLYQQAEDVFGTTISAIRYGFPPKMLESCSNVPLSSVLNRNDTLHVDFDAESSKDTCNGEVLSNAVGPTHGSYDDRSLRPNWLCWITWDGTDDVCLEEWLQKIRPSCLNDTQSYPVDALPACSWICVKNIQQDSPGYQRRAVANHSPKNKDWEAFKAPLRGISDIIARGAKVPKAAKRWCVDEIMKIAKENDLVVGKWLVYASFETADEIWEKIAKATAMGKLGCSSKVMPTKSLSPGQRTVMCIYVNDSTDKREVQRVLKYLYDDMGITVGLSNFKPDIFTHLNIYTKNEWRLKPTLYNWKDALEWDLSSME